MKLEIFDYDLPRERIAQEPLGERDASRLLVLRRNAARVEHSVFSSFPDFLERGDLVVINETRVVQARLIAKKPTGGLIDVLVLNPEAGDGAGGFECLVSGRVRENTPLELKQGALLKLLGRNPGGSWNARLEWSGPPSEYLNRFGLPPLPPYIKRKDPAASAVKDSDRYQTVFASTPGSVAAPTAGLHFTDKTFAALSARGVGVARVRLHVGRGTFKPVEAAQVEDHHMHSESFELTPECADRINSARSAGHRVCAVGTTSVRVMEACADGSGRVAPRSGETGLYIHPGYEFKVTDIMLTNFHMPRSSLLLLAYAEALTGGYRFLSFGDAMLIQ
jgi:S-adenosylmethionine:tRNA ribosyltransferase-isomerase